MMNNERGNPIRKLVIHEKSKRNRRSFHTSPDKRRRGQEPQSALRKKLEQKEMTHKEARRKAKEQNQRQWLNYRGKMKVILAFYFKHGKDDS